MFKNLFGRPKPATADLPGLYRRHREEDVERFTALAEAAFPDLKGAIRCFGADWLGRQFATDARRVEGGKPQVVLIEPGTGEVLEIPADIDSFHTTILVDEADAAVAEPFYRDWLASGGARPAYDQCIGYIRPLFLGGADDLGNLELSDLDVYWTITGQILTQIRDGRG